MGLHKILSLTKCTPFPVYVDVGWRMPNAITLLTEFNRTPRRRLLTVRIFTVRNSHTSWSSGIERVARVAGLRLGLRSKCRADVARKVRRVRRYGKARSRVRCHREWGTERAECGTRNTDGMHTQQWGSKQQTQWSAYIWVAVSDTGRKFPVANFYFFYWSNFLFTVIFLFPVRFLWWSRSRYGILLKP